MPLLRKGLLLSLLLGFSCLLAAAECEDPRPLRIAQIPLKNPELLSSQFKPLYRHLEKTLARRVEVIRMPSYAAVVEALLAGNVDLAELGPAAYAMAHSRKADIVAFAALAEPRGELFDTKNGYYSVLFTRADKGFQTLADLRGKSLSLVDPSSTSGALFPRRLVLNAAGQQLEAYFRQISYAGSHDRAIEAVQKGLVDAAFVSSMRVDEMIRRGALRKDEFRLLWQSEPIPFDPFVYRSALCRPLADRIRHAFLGQHEDLKPYFGEIGRPGFVPVSDENYREIREIYATFGR